MTPGSRLISSESEKLSGTIQVTTPGCHTLHVWKVDPSIALDRIVIDTGAQALFRRAAPAGPECPAPPPQALGPPVSTSALAAAAPPPLLPPAPDVDPPQLGRIRDLQLESGDVIKDCQVEYRIVGSANADKSNVVVGRLVQRHHQG